MSAIERLIAAYKGHDGGPGLALVREARAELAEYVSLAADAVEQYDAHVRAYRSRRTERAADGFFVWRFEVEVAPIWVANGYSPDDADVHKMMQRRLRDAMASETRARVLASPDPIEVATEQGVSL